MQTVSGSVSFPWPLSGNRQQRERPGDHSGVHPRAERDHLQTHVGQRGQPGQVPQLLSHHVRPADRAAHQGFAEDDRCGQWCAGPGHQHLAGHAFAHQPVNLVSTGARPGGHDQRAGVGIGPQQRRYLAAGIAQQFGRLILQLGVHAEIPGHASP